MKNVVFVAFFLFSSLFLHSQTVTLSATGNGDAYSLINSKFAPSGDVCETPDCVHPEAAPHIRQVYDSVLGKYVFAFYAHVHPDNDRCQVFDRQRTEIKTYAYSAPYMLGYKGDSVRYEWDFFLPAGFKPSSSFTHLHQVKPVDGDDGMPIFTLTARKGSPNKLELRHNSETTLKSINLSLIEGKWVHINEIIKVNENAGYYKITITDKETNASIMSYTSSNYYTIKSGNSFIRPKWGIYRSLLDSTSLRDEEVRFDNFKITKFQMSSNVQPELKKKDRLNVVCADNLLTVTGDFQLDDELKYEICNIEGKVLKQQRLSVLETGFDIDVFDLPSGMYVLRVNDDVVKFYKN
ncbi:MAG: heparin lyase I family protein [Bacteroidales bacterium]|jgi:hypothetical protein|nr:heparin lyase I family protein [Bacteroidales bacterium]